MRARAVVFREACQVEFREVSVPDPGPNDVVVQTRYSWISNGTEGSFLRGERVNGETPYRPGEARPFPLVAGYQSTGVVMHVGRDVTDLRPGQWVFSTIGRVKDMYEPWGGHVSPKVSPRDQVWPLPKDVSPVSVSGLVLTQVGYNCGARPPVQVGDTALVIGDGMVGHWAAQTLHWRGASVILAGKHDDRLALFAPGERRYTLNGTRQDLAAAVREIAPEGVHVLVDTVGSVATIMACHPLMRYNGHIVSAGFNAMNSTIDLQKLRFGELTLHSPSGWERRRMDDTLALITSGHLQTEKLITHRFPAERAPEAWDLILKRDAPVLGIILTWS